MAARANMTNRTTAKDMDAEYTISALGKLYHSYTGKFGKLESDVRDIKIDVKVLKADVKILKSYVKEIKRDVKGIMAYLEKWEPESKKT